MQCWTDNLFQVFRSGFAEGNGLEGPSSDNGGTFQSSPPDNNISSRDGDDEEADDDHEFPYRFQDSDDEDDEDVVMTDDTRIELHLPPSSVGRNTEEDSVDQTQRDAEVWNSTGDVHQEGAADSNELTDETVAPPHPSQPGSPLRSSSRLEGTDAVPTITGHKRVHASTMTSPTLGPRKVRIVVADAAYSTYRAVLYYVGFGSPSD